MREKFQIVWKDPKKLKPSTFNPARRTSSGHSMTSLRRSIRKHGIQEPLRILKNDVVDDGHRRREAAILEDIAEVPCYIADKSLYAEINTQRMRHSSLQWLEIYLKQGEIPNHVQGYIMRIEDHMGKQFLRMLLKEEISPSGLEVAVGRIVKHTGAASPAFRKKVYNWLVSHRQIYVVKHASETNSITGAKLKLAIDKNRPLTSKYG